MSKKMEAIITCPECQNKFPTILYRSIWIEYPENRDLIFSDKINRVECMRCHNRMLLPFAFLATNVKRNFAVWFEPRHDHAVDSDVQAYSAQFGPDCFYARAPRIADYEEFKETIMKFEKGELRGNPPDISGRRIRAAVPTPKKNEIFLDRLLRLIGIK